MRSTQGPSGLYYHHNGDFSGGVRVEVPLGRRGGEDHGVVSIDNNRGTVEVEIPFGDMKHLVLESYRSRLISRLEQADDEVLERLFGFGAQD